MNLFLLRKMKRFLERFLSAYVDKTRRLVVLSVYILEGCQDTSLHHQGLSLLQAGPDHLNGINLSLCNI